VQRWVTVLGGAAGVLWPWSHPGRDESRGPGGSRGRDDQVGMPSFARPQERGPPVSGQRHAVAEAWARFALCRRRSASPARTARPGGPPDRAVTDGGVRSPRTDGYLGVGGGAGAAGESGQELGHGGAEMPGGDGGCGGEGSPGSVLPMGSTASQVRTAARYVDESGSMRVPLRVGRDPAHGCRHRHEGTQHGHEPPEHSRASPARAAVRVSNSGPVIRPGQVGGLLEPFRCLGTDRREAHNNSRPPQHLRGGAGVEPRETCHKPATHLR
jgi:hypothetical protein